MWFFQNEYIVDQIMIPKTFYKLVRAYVAVKFWFQLIL